MQRRFRLPFHMGAVQLQRVYSSSVDKSTAKRASDHVPNSQAASTFADNRDERQLNSHENVPPFIDFGKHEVIFKKKSVLELARSYAVMSFCSYDFLVDNSLKLMNLGMRMLGGHLFTALMRASFYGQFAASPQSVTLVARRLSEATIVPMLATTAEEEVGDDPNHINEIIYNNNLRTMLACLDVQAEVGRGHHALMSQVKMTSYFKADVLSKLSDALDRMKFNFSNDSPICVSNLRNGLDGDLKMIPGLTEEEFIHLQHALNRMDAILQRALKCDVRILVDAEFVCINPAISLISFALMKKYNMAEPRVWKTYQCYLKHALNNVKRGLAVADSEGFQFGVKLVRGAYLDYERSEAEAEGRQDPVNPTYEATNEMYDFVAAYLLDEVRQRGGDRLNVIFATHNVESVQKAIKRMWELGLPPTEGSVVFGQVMGMCDHISYGLGQAGYLTYKSIPYGMCQDVLPYISRRAVENKTVFHRLQQEKKMLRDEMVRRSLAWRE